MNSEKPNLHFYIDVVGSCNLRCPSCPVGNSPNVVNSRGMMLPSMLDQILEKAVAESVVTNVGLFNWTEPMINDRLDEMVRIVKKYELPCAVSSNLNISNPERYRKLLEANPNVVRVSLSGFSQEKYGITHRGGSIEKLKKNLELLLQMKEDTKSTTLFALAFHRYFSNLDEEKAVGEYCKSKGIFFLPVNALMLPLEKVLAYCGEESFATINEDDEEIISNLSLPLKEALASAASAEADSCKLLEQQIPINWKGEVMLCCAVYDEKKFLVGNYIKESLETIQAKRKQNLVCKTCSKHGASNYFQYNIPGIDQLVIKNIFRHSQKKVAGK